uniref:kelch-like protein 22 isoform X2 n=1 Tax=Myxine glutinosa TaxID=7769 RepID=UPI00358E6A1F
MAKALIATLMDKAAAAKSKETSDAQTRMVTQRLPKSRQLFLSIEHASGLLAGLAELQASSSMYDVTLRVEGRPLKAHRVVLAAACEYFRGMFARGLKEARQEEIIIHEVRFSAMEKLIRFIYTAELELSVEEVQDVLMASVLLQLSPVIEFCCDFLMSWVEAENIPELYQLADVYGLRQLAKQLDTYLLENFSSFSRTDAYRHLPMEKVRFLLNSDKLQVSSEREVFQAALLYHHSTGIPGGSTRGLKQDEDYDCFDEDDETNLMWRRALANPPKLLECVRYALLSSRMVQSLYSRLNPCPLKEILADALAYHSNEMLQPVLQTWQTRLRSTYRCVVGFGGMYSTEDNDLNDEAKFLNPKTQRWQTFQPAGRTPRLSNQGIAVINDFVFLVGGDNNTHGFRAVSDCWRYDPRHNKWSSIAPLQQEHADHCLCAVGSFLYVVGGRDYVTELREVERYSLETNSWEYVQPLPREGWPMKIRSLSRVVPARTCTSHRYCATNPRRTSGISAALPQWSVLGTVWRSRATSFTCWAGAIGATAVDGMSFRYTRTSQQMTRGQASLHCQPGTASLASRCSRNLKTERWRSTWWVDGRTTYTGAQRTCTCSA